MDTKQVVFYLYHKISNLGLNYLGITQRNPYTYNGSGKYWKRHLKANGIKSKDIKTIILLETQNEKELMEKSRYYSDLYDVVNSKEWANLIPETGENTMFGYRFSSESKKKMSESRRGKYCGDKNPMFGKEVCEETRKKISKSNTGKKKSKDVKNKISNKLKGNKNTLGYRHTDETKIKISESNIGKHNIPKSKEEKEMMSIRRRGRGNENYNPTPVLQCDMDLNIIREWRDLFSLLEFGYTARQKKEISRACRGKIKTYNGFIWKFKE